jgi:hypothetical protein
MRLAIHAGELLPSRGLVADVQNRIVFARTDLAGNDDCRRECKDEQTPTNHWKLPTKQIRIERKANTQRYLLV